MRPCFLITKDLYRRSNSAKVTRRRREEMRNMKDGNKERKERPSVGTINGSHYSRIFLSGRRSGMSGQVWERGGARE